MNWINVNDELPPIGTEILMFIPHGINKRRYTYDGGENYFLTGEFDGKVFTDNMEDMQWFPTHWMCLFTPMTIDEIETGAYRARLEE